MLSWLRDNLGTILLTLLLAALLAAIIGYLIRQRKQGKTSCGCGCANCAMSGICHKKPNDQP